MQDLADQLFRYEAGALTKEEEVLELFAGLIASGWCLTLQGHYGRTAQALIDDGWISEDGEVLVYFVDQRHDNFRHHG